MEIACRRAGGPIALSSSTRRYINLDDAGGTSRYVAPADITRGVGRYLAESLTDALDALELWELPWMKPGLEAFRYGLSWDERWVLHPDAENAPSTEAEARKVAREVRRRRLRVL